MDESEHLTPDSLETYFRAGQVVNIRLSSQPDCRLRLSPQDQTLELWTPVDDREPDVTTLSRVSLTREDMDSGDWFVLRVDANGLHFEAYTLLAAIVDELEGGRSFARATEEALEAYRDLLSGRGGMSPQKQEGLIGELLVLMHAIDQIGEDKAMEAWLGPRSEEHDFIFSTFDAEVKTTTGEQRQHVIGTATQLQRSPDRPLWLISVQLTRGGGAVNSMTLDQLIGDIRSGLKGTRKPFDKHLRALGWRDHDADLYGNRYLLRSTPTAYHVDDDFPSLTQSLIDEHVSRPELISAVSYRLNVSSLTAAAPPEPLAGFVKERSL